MSASDPFQLNLAPRRKWLTPLVGVGLWLAGVTVVTGLISVVVWQMGKAHQRAVAFHERKVWESIKHRSAVLRETYADRSPAVAGPRWREIEAFLNELTKPDTDKSKARWVQVLDEERLRDRIMSWPWVKSLSRYDREQIKSESILEYSTGTPNQFQRIELVHIAAWQQENTPAGDESADGNELLVSTFARRGKHEVEPVLFWIYRSEGQWKLVDWEIVDSGYCASERAALTESAIRDRLAANYRRSFDLVRQADGANAAGDQKYIEHLRQAEACVVPPQSADELRNMIITRWSLWHHHDEVRRMMKLMKDPDRFPGLCLMQATACQRLGAPDEALALTDRIEQQTGFRPDVVRLRAQIFQQTHRQEDAIAAWRRLVEFEPDDISNLATLFWLLPEAERPSIIERIKSAPEATQLAVRFANFNLHQLSAMTLQELAQFIQQIAPDSEEAREIEVARQNTNIRERKLATLRDAYTGQPPVLSDPRTDGIQKFLDELMTPDTRNEKGKWVQFLDAERLRDRIVNSPWVRSLKPEDRRIVEARPMEDYAMGNPNQFRRIDLVHIAPRAHNSGLSDYEAAADDELLVFTFAQRGYTEVEPVWFCLRETEGQWKLVDWEIVDGGLSASEQAALAESTHADKQSEIYSESLDFLTHADTTKLVDKDEFAKYLKLAEACPIPSQSADRLRYLIMIRWSNRYEHEVVRRLAESIQDPDRFPEALVMQAKACQRLGATDEALAFTSRIEQLFGFRPDVVRLRAELLQKSNRQADAISEWKRLVDFDPSDVSNLSALYWLQPDAERAAVIERIKAHQQAARVAYQFANFNLNQLATSTLQDLMEFVQQVAPDSDEARGMKIAQFQKEDRERKVAAVRESYSGKRFVPTDPRFGEIETFLKEVTKPDTENEKRKWIGLLDEQRFRDRVMHSPWVTLLSATARTNVAARSINSYAFEDPNSVFNLNLIRILPWQLDILKGHDDAQTDGVLAFTFAKRHYNEVEPVLFWLHKVEDQWKLVDWEMIDGGFSASERAALGESAIRDNLNDNYRESHELLRLADAATYTNEEEYVRCLRQAEHCPVPIQSADFMRYLILGRWNFRHHYDEVRRFAKALQNPDRFPGTLVMRATACQQTGASDEALEWIARLEQQAGFRPNMVKLRAQILQRTNRLQEAIAEWRRLLDFDSSDAADLTTLYWLLPATDRHEVIERIKSANKPASLTLQFVNFNSYRLATATLQELSQFVQQIAPDSDEARGVAIALLHQDHQYRSAADLYRRAAENETDRIKQRRYWRSYFQEMEMADDLLSGFAAHPDPKVAFKMLLSGLEDGESMVEGDDLPALFDAYRRTNPDDFWLSYYEGVAAAHQYRFTEASRHFAAAEDALAKHRPATTTTLPDDSSDDVDADILTALLREQWSRVKYELGEDNQILADYGWDVSFYHTLASLAIERRHWTALARLNIAFAARHRDDPQLLVNEARLSLAHRDFADVKNRLQTMSQREEKEKWLKYSRESLEQELLVLEFPDPVQAFERSADRKATFGQLSRDLLANRDWIKLDEVIQRHPGGPDDPEVLHARIEQAWRQSDDSKLVELLIPWPTAALKRQSYMEHTWRERLTRSLLRLQRLEQAQKIADEARQSYAEYWPLVMTLVATHDAAGIAQLLAQDESFAEEWKSRDFAEDSALRPILTDEAFAGLRLQQLFALPSRCDSESLMLFLKAPTELSKSWLQQQFSKGESLDSATGIIELSPTEYVVTWKAARFLLLAVPDSIIKTWPRADDAFISGRWEYHAELNLLFQNQHGYWQIVRLADEDDQPWDSPRTTVREFGAKLLNANVIAAMHTPYLYSFSQMIALPCPRENDENHDVKLAAQTDLLASRRPLDELDARAMTARVTHQPTRLSPEKRQILAQIAASQKCPPIVAQVQFGNSEVPLTLPFRVQEVHYRRYGGLELYAEYAGDNVDPRFPELSSGIKFIVPIERVADISVTEQPQ